MPVDVPVFRITLEGVKYSLLKMIELQSGELEKAAMAGIKLAYSTLPALVSERCRVATIEAIQEATEEALKEYFSPGGRGYEVVLKKVEDFIKEGL
jgi:hypothetical protein